MQLHRRILAGLSIVLLFCCVHKLTWVLRAARLRRIASTDVAVDEGEQSAVWNETLGFRDIFVINLYSRSDRRIAMTHAGALSNLSFSFLKGLSPDDIPDSPRGSTNTIHEQNDKSSLSSTLPAGARASWHSHMSAVQGVIERNLASALILEDDIDWDVRIKSQMKTFAAAARTWLAASEASKSRDGMREEGRSLVDDFTKEHGYSYPDSSQSHLSSSENDLDSHTSPYGNDWDVLWLGHCGADIPVPKALQSLGGSSSALKVVSIPNDMTVPASKHLKPHPFAHLDEFGRAYPAHTRVVHASWYSTCSLAYAISQKGARKLVRRFNMGQKSGFGFPAQQWDIMLRDYCMGRPLDFDKEREKDGGSRSYDEYSTKSSIGSSSDERLVCLTVQPPLFSHHFAGHKGEGGGAFVSDIRGQAGGYAVGKQKQGSPYIRLSVKENLELLAAGVPLDELVDQFPDDGEPFW
ncbi:glycosyltransferase family 25 protein [Xylariaceae sp. FL0255]|nr:glycosyltransferase family 25 protein [Xylariaceae sp. FL0255]